MKKKVAFRVIGCIGLVILIFLAQGYLTVGRADVLEDGSLAAYSVALLPPLLFGLLAAAGLWLAGGLRGGESPLDAVPGLVMAVVVCALVRAPVFGGRYPEGSKIQLTALFYTLLALLLVDLAAALVRRKPMKFHWKRALLQFLCVLALGAVAYVTLRYGQWRLSLGMQTGGQSIQMKIRLGLYGVYALNLLAGLALLPFVKIRSRGSAVALLAAGAAHIAIYLVNSHVGFLNAVEPLKFLGPRGFNSAGCIGLPAGYAFASIAALCIPQKQLDKTKNKG